MSSDITFCGTKDCPLKGNCFRNEELAPTDHPVSMSNFEWKWIDPALGGILGVTHIATCEYYFPIKSQKLG